MIRSTLMVLTVSSVLSISSMAAFAQSSGNDAPVDKGGMPPSTEMNAGSGDGKALAPGSIGGGNAGDASGSSAGSGSGGGSGESGSSGGSGMSGGGSGGSEGG